MHSHAPQQRQRPTKDYAPVKRKNPAIGKLAILLAMLFIIVLMYSIFPKEAGKRIGDSRFDGLVISEVMSSNGSSVPDENGSFEDWLELYNGTGADLDMEGVMLTNRTDTITFPFPAYTLKAGERVIIFASDSYQLELGKPFHGKFKISSVGDHLYLYDPDMYLIDEMITPTMISDTSYQLIGYDDHSNPLYEVSSFYSPGYENGEDGYVAYRSANATEIGTLIINEVCPDPKVGIPDEDGEIVDWVELRNTTNQAISLGGYYLSDNENKPLKWQFPDNAIIPPNGYYLVFCSSKNKMQQNGIPHSNFGISAEKETLVLSDGIGRLIDRVTIENVAEDYSIGRLPTGEWQAFSISTPGYSNDTDGQAKADEIVRAYNPTGVFITEIMASNDTFPIGVTSALCDYVELYNSSTQTVDLSYYGLSDNIGRPRQWQFPQGTVIEPGQFMVILLDDQPELSTYAELHTNFSISRAGGDTICFSDPTGKVLDRLPLTLIPTDHSYGRTLNASGLYYYDEPTPGEPNGYGYYGYASVPSFSEPGGEYTGSKDITITVPNGCEVYYSTDGSIPTVETGIFYEPGTVLTMARVTVLRARAFDEDGRLQPSDTITQTYLPNLFHAFPIVSLVTDPDHLWNPEIGMLTVGENVIKDYIPFENTIYREVKENLPAKPGHVEFYEDGNQVLSQDMEFGLQGQYSLDMPQKTFKVRAKARYGSKYFDAKLFEDRDFTQYKSFVLRMSGNDNAWTRLIDGFQGHLIDCFNDITDTPSTVIHQAWKPVVVYLNGVYWGHYNMRERVDRFFVAQHEGLTLEEANGSMDILEASGKVNEGSNKEYNEMIATAKTLSPGTSDEDLQYLLDRIDINSYFDYMAFEMFFGNSDPGNIRFYKLYEEGSKWKWIIYDMDYGLFSSGFNSPYSYLKETGAGQQNIDNTLLRKLLESDKMVDQFLTRLGEIYQVFTTDFMIETLQPMVDLLAPEMPLHFARWAEETDKAITFDNPTTPEGAYRYWQERIERLRNVLRKRPTYFYEMIQVQFKLTEEQMIPYFGEKPAMPTDATDIEGYIPMEKWV